MLLKKERKRKKIVKKSNDLILNVKEDEKVDCQYLIMCRDKIRLSIANY